ncbi:hypothetical protein [Cryobacterium sp. PH31-O1]|uniref:hypothetical protein n=1 Tax=Cryobacterium sp. PH31-O1 TaxID=3046306 RepID=UPI0024BB48E8|nr:hypothetical protein [Cryobacterium sp. PH31-O1]MDJ0338262.1 hypothetical protein [Cryobacterium sp. PH31-O1]
MSRSFYRDEIVRVRANETTSAHGGTELSWAAATRSTLTGVRVQALSSDERDGRTTATHRLLGPLNLPLTAKDRVEYLDPRGLTRTYQVVGEPLWYRGPTGAVGHTETELKAVDV